MTKNVARKDRRYKKRTLDRIDEMTGLMDRMTKNQIDKLNRDKETLERIKTQGVYLDKKLRFTENVRGKENVVTKWEHEEIDVTEDEIEAALVQRVQLLKNRIEFVPGKKMEIGFQNLKSKLTPIEGSQDTLFLIDPDTIEDATITQDIHDLKSVQQSLEEEYSSIDTPLTQPSYFLFSSKTMHSKHMLKWTQIQTKPMVGLENLGNTCFMNSTLQCLFYTVPFINYLQSLQVKEEDPSEFDALNMMVRLYDQLTTTNKKYIEPEEMARNLPGIGGFLLGRQEDAHEFFIQLVDKMETSLLKTFKGKLDKRTSETNAIHQMFGGYLRSQITSLESRFKSNTYDPFIGLSLDIANNDNLERCLEEYISPNILDGNDKYFCPKTQRYEKAQKTLTIHEAPPVMVFHLKRFNLKGRKIRKMVHFPEILDLQRHMTKKTANSNIYMLYSVLVHDGRSCSSGHYYSFVKNSADIWYEMNDRKAKISNINTVLHQNAYLLFYRKRYVQTSPETPTMTTPQKIQESLLNIFSPPKRRPSLNQSKDLLDINEESPVRKIVSSSKESKISAQTETLVKNHPSNNSHDQEKNISTTHFEPTISTTQYGHHTVENWDGSISEIHSSDDHSSRRKRKRNDIDILLDQGKLKKKRQKKEFMQEGENPFNRAMKRNMEYNTRGNNYTPQEDSPNHGNRNNDGYHRDRGQRRGQFDRRGGGKDSRRLNFDPNRS